MIVPTKETLRSWKEASVRTILASEKAVERQFQAGRLVASLAVGLFLVGFLLVAQWRGVETYRDDLEGRSEQDLALIVNELGAENDELRRETLRLEQQIAEAYRTEEGQVAVLNQAARELQALQVLAGIEPAAGPGVSVSLSDPQGVLLAKDLVEVVNELKAAGAEAVSVDGVRVGATSGFTQAEDGISLDGEGFSGTVVVYAIGDPGTLSQAIGMPGGIGATLTSFPGVAVDVEERDLLEVPAADIRRMEHGEAFAE